MARILILYYGPPILFMALIFGGSSQAELPDWWPIGLDIPHLDKAIHGAEYMVLALLWIRALTQGRLRNATARVLAAAVAISFVYGITDEIHQSFVEGRTADPLDAAADLLGAGLAAGVIRCLRSLRLPRTPDDLDAGQ